MKEKKRRKHFILQNKGTLLVEVMLTACLFSIICVCLASIMMISGLIFRTNDAHAQVSHNAMQVLNFIGKEIKEAGPIPSHMVIDDTANNQFDAVSFQVPVALGTNTSVTDANGTIQWGAYDILGQTQQGTTNTPTRRWVSYFITRDPTTGMNLLTRQVLDANGIGIANLTTLVTNNVQSFGVDRNGNMDTITVVLQPNNTDRDVDPVTFRQSVYIRNA